MTSIQMRQRIIEIIVKKLIDKDDILECSSSGQDYLINYGDDIGVIANTLSLAIVNNCPVTYDDSED